MQFCRALPHYLNDEASVMMMLKVWSHIRQIYRSWICMRAVWKVRELKSLLRVRTLWRCGDGLFFEVPPLVSDALLTTLHPLLDNVLQTVDHFESSCLVVGKAQKSHGARSGLYGTCSNWVPLIHFFQFRSLYMWFLGFSDHENGALRSKSPVPLSSWSLRQTVCSTFSRNGWSVVWSASLTKGGTSKTRPSPHLHKVPTRSNKLSPRTLQTSLV
jgi:hypothetical protein